MRAAVEWVALAMVMAWVGFAIAGSVGAVAMVLVVLGLRGWVPVAGLMALLAPLGVMLPALALRQMAAGMGVAVIPFGGVELVVFLLAYLVFLASAMGVLRVDIYRMGYAPLPVAIMVLVLCGYGALMGQVFLPLVAVLGQVLWIMGWGSSNWFDHVLHAVLVPVTIVVLILRLV